jgi:5-hydroxyisourate hydrolase
MITTHILDVSKGRPASGVPVTLEFLENAKTWRVIGRDTTDADGRARNLTSTDTFLNPGVYRLTFDTAGYFIPQQTESFYPEVTVAFNVTDATQHYHVPLLLSPFGFTTYRGS